MRILLFGANGQVGTELRRSLAPLGEVVATTRSGRLDDGTPCEAADFDAPEALPPMVARLSPDVVVNAAAHTAVDRAESEPEAAFRANAEAPAAIAAVMLLVFLLEHLAVPVPQQGRLLLMLLDQVGIALNIGEQNGS